MINSPLPFSLIVKKFSFSDKKIASFCVINNRGVKTMEDSTLLFGRQWVVSQKDSSIFTLSSKIPAIENEKCNRCGTKVEHKLPSDKYYCRGCIGIGRIVEGCFLVRQNENYEYPEKRKVA